MDSPKKFTSEQENSNFTLPRGGSQGTNGEGPLRFLNMISIRSAAVAFLITLTGCSSTSLLKPSKLVSAPLEAVGLKKSPLVAKILCLWEASEGQGLDEKPARGFAGQIIFFGYGEATPVKTDGIVRIYEYTDYDADDPDPEPAHVFVFDNGGWNAHRTEGTLGQTYNCFLPYVEKKTGHVVCALRVEYEAKDGRKVSSPFTEVTLAAKTSTKPPGALTRNIVKNKRFGIQQVNGERPAEKTARKLESTTIKIPASLRQENTPTDQPRTRLLKM